MRSWTLKSHGSGLAMATDGAVVYNIVYYYYYTDKVQVYAWEEKSGPACHLFNDHG